MEKKKEEKVVDAKAENVETKETKSVTFNLGTLSVILCLISLGLTLLFRIIGFFAALSTAVWVVIMILALGVAVFGMVLAWIDSKQKFTLSLAFSAFAILLNVIIYF